MSFPRRLLILVVAAVLVALCTAYLPYVGLGFKQDDFGWIASSRIRDAGDWLGRLGRNTGFYRPVVAMTRSSAVVRWPFWWMFSRSHWSRPLKWPRRISSSNGWSRS